MTETIIVRFECNRKNKSRKVPLVLTDDELTQLIVKIYGDLVGRKFHLEVTSEDSKGSWIESGEDWDNVIEDITEELTNMKVKISMKVVLDEPLPPPAPKKPPPSLNNPLPAAKFPLPTIPSALKELIARYKSNFQPKMHFNIDRFYEIDPMLEETIHILRKQRMPCSVFHIAAQFCEKIGIADLQRIMKKYTQMGIIRMERERYQTQANFSLNPEMLLMDTFVPLEKKFQVIDADDTDIGSQIAENESNAKQTPQQESPSSSRKSIFLDKHPKMEVDDAHSEDPSIKTIETNKSPSPENNEQDMDMELAGESDSDEVDVDMAK